MKSEPMIMKKLNDKSWLKNIHHTIKNKVTLTRPLTETGRVVQKT